MINKGINDPDRVTFHDEVIKRFWEQCDLRSALALNVRWHINGAQDASLIIVVNAGSQRSVFFKSKDRIGGFHTAWAQSRHLIRDRL